jgi:hypothetical protein
MLAKIAKWSERKARPSWLRESELKGADSDETGGALFRE